MPPNNSEGRLPNSTSIRTIEDMKASRTYGIGVAALAASATFFAISNSAGKTPDIWTFLFWLALLAAVELLPVSLGFGPEVTMGFPIHLAMAIVFAHQGWVAMTIAGLAAIDMRELRREIPIWRGIFNRSQSLLSVGAACGVLALFPDQILNPAVIAAAALAHLVTNLSLVGMMVHLYFGPPFREALKSLVPTPYLGFGISYVLLTGLGVATAVASEKIGAWSVVAILIPLLFARLSILGARNQQDLSERVREQQKSLLEATERVFEERERERHRIAEEIHDNSLQMLAASAYGLSNAEEFIASDQIGQANEAILNAREAINGAMTALREALVDLRRSTVEEGGLMETIRHFADQVALLWGAEVTIQGEIKNEPPLPVALAAFQILQEGLTNALKHGQASSVVVRISDEDGLVHIVVEDKGPGFDPEAEVGTDHVGMRLMKERAARVGGSIEFDSRPGAGTRLEAILPGGVGL
jgi:signal transduction histidine kinase